MRNFKFPKKERIKSRKVISSLFRTGLSQFVYPFKLVYHVEKAIPPGDESIQFAVSIPKRKIKSAVKRNILKRRTREAYRQNRQFLNKGIDIGNHKVYLMFIYVDSEIKKYDIIEKSIIKHLKKLNEKLGS
ncbi:MAG: ribonuclease P protein component [Bacteroidia bacterium]|nr:ribonuclease P protein component [Bacteroidia bacterium]